MGYAKHEIGVMRAARERIEAGQSLRGVAREFGISPSTAARWAAGMVKAKEEKQITDSFQSVRSPDLIAAALSIPIDSAQGEKLWAEFGRAHPPRGLDPEQSARVFEAVAFGLSFPLAFEAAGLKGGDAEVYAARCKEGIEPEASFFRALKIARAWIVMRATRRVSEGLGGWQGASRLLAALDPQNWGERPESESIESSLDSLTAEAILGICERQIAEMKGHERRYTALENPEIIPLSETGMDEEGELAT